MGPEGPSDNSLGRSEGYCLTPENESLNGLCVTSQHGSHLDPEKAQMSCMTILGCLAQLLRPHLGPRIRAAPGRKGPSRSSGPNAYQRLEPHPVTPALCLNTLGDGELTASRSSQSWKAPGESSSLISSLHRWRHVQHRQNSLSQGHPASPTSGRGLFPASRMPHAPVTFHFLA